MVVTVGGELVAERWAPGLTAASTLPSWSMAKSVLHAAVGVLVGEGRMALDEPAPVPGATLEDLLAMRDGLAWREDYLPGGASDVQEMLFGPGRADTAAYVLAKPAAHPPGSTFCYSSGTSNVISAMVADRVGRGDAYLAWLRGAVLGPAGMPGAIPKLDGAGVWMASSYLFATAREFAAFGQRCLDGGAGWLPDGWLAAGTRLRSHDDDGQGYGLHWWVVDDDLGTYEARGFEGQSITIAPALDAVIVRLGRTPIGRVPAVRAWRHALLRSLPA